MKNVRRLLLATVIAMTAAPAFTAGATRQRIDSRWRDVDVVVDGNDAEWKGPLVQVADKTPITAAAVNDDRALYVVLSASDPAVRMQILRQGLIVWFDPAGGTKKHFGVKFPVGAGFDSTQRRGGGGSRGGSARQGAGSPDAEQGLGALEPPNRMELFGAGKDDARSFMADMVPGIAVKVGQVEGALVYELKVPIEKTGEFAYAIGAQPGALIGFGLETPKIERSSSAEGGSERGGGGGRRGGMGRMGGGRGGSRQGAEAAKPLKAWATIQLARH